MNGAAKASAKTNGAGQLHGVRRDRELHFRSMFEGSALGMAMCTLDGRILETNAAFARLLAYRREEIASLHIRDLGARDAQPDGHHFEELKHTREFLKQEVRHRRKDGSELQGQLTISVVRDAAGEPALLFALLEDMTESKRAEDKSREAEKMEVIGRLAGGIAHDFNNLLTGVLLYCDLLADEIEPGTRLRQHVEEIRLAGEQGAALTQQLLMIARKQAPQPRPISLNDVVSTTENLLRRLIGEQIELVTQLAPSSRMILADPAQLRQVLLNLVLNARDAMPQGGRITVRTQDSHRGNGAHSMASLLVADTGSGMDEQTRARLFEPFFTTKAPGHGTGLGLATVQRIVSESGGKIEVKSEPGRGTQIAVLLPALEAAPEARVPTKHSRTKPTVLLVDDHTSARNSIQRVLHQAGYRVLPAASGKRALKVFAESPDEVGLLLADWMMPGMSGRELAEKLRHQKPNLKVLLISGYHEPRDGAAIDSVELIRKPFAGRVLLERIREVLDSKGDSTW